MVVIMGNIGNAKMRDVKMKNGETKKALDISVADNIRNGSDKETVWYSATIWDKYAEKMAEYLTKGKTIQISGDLSPRVYVSEKTGKPGVDLRILRPEIKLGSSGNGKKEDATESDEDEGGIADMPDGVDEALPFS